MWPDELKQENLSPEQRAQYEKELAQWNSGGLILNAIGAGLAAPTNSIGGIIAATASPVLSYQIGQYFKVLAHKNQITGGKDELTTGQEAAHILAHTILGAAVAAAGGNDALAGGLAAAGAEATAPILSQWLYGKNPADLTADEKATISAIAGLTGAATGVAVGGSMADVAQGDQAGHIAVDNNTEFGDKIREYINDTKRYWHTEKEAKDNLDVIRNVAVNLIGDGLDSVVGLADYGIDSLNALVYCTGVTPNLCNQMQATLDPKNKAALDSIKAVFDTRTYIQFYELLDKAAHGDLQAREAAGELLAAVLITKKPKLNVGGISKAGIKVTEKAVVKVANAAKKEVIEAGKSITKPVTKAETGIEWGKGIQKQGMPWEDFVGQELPAGSRLPPNFKTFDYFDRVTGKAVSVKTLDTTTPAKIANPKQIFNTLKNNIDAAADFTRHELRGATVLSTDISSREIRLAVPATTNKVQWQQIHRAIDYGKSRGVKVIVTEVK
ncbi:VENN motif pre-toxin domain-containing protein [Snodgrassella communis]|uniref:endonuclease toxin domain-containing protein n=1 Tax=Snodgrassella communis TaxID=2946699 RepID=UPI001EF5703E|nr:VENN motif pre-toxin domain-containing protein [Snodgrassella communis]